MLLPGIATNLISSFIQNKAQKDKIGRDLSRSTEGFNRSQAEEKSQRKAFEGKLGVGQSYRDYLMRSKQDPVADAARRAQTEQQATNLDALGRGGARALLGGLQSTSSNYLKGMQGIEADSFTRGQSALKDYAAQDELSRGRERSYAQERYKDAQTAGAKFRENMFKAQDSEASRKANFATGLIGTAGGMFGAGLGSEVSSLFGGGGGASNAVDGFNNATPAQQAFFMDPENQAMISGFMKAGGKVEKTPGEFSHESNPIDIMQEGAKIGEMTGGEYVINPEQASKIAQQSKFAKSLFKTFDKKSK